MDLVNKKILIGLARDVRKRKEGWVEYELVWIETYQYHDLFH